MAIKVSTLLAHNTVVQDDATPKLGGSLDTNGFVIQNGVNPVTISSNQYPIADGTPGQVMTTDGLGVITFADITAGPLTLTGDVTGTGTGTVATTIAPTGVTAASYGSSSSVGTFTVNSKGQLTAAGNTPISITPSAAGLGNVTNSLQVINLGGAPSIQEGAGAPTGAASSGAVYIDQAVTNGNGISVYDGTSWIVVATKPNLYNENSSAFTPPAALGTNSIALGSGAETAAGATGSLSIGQQALARIQGAVVQANGRFTNNGDAQAGRYMLRSNTINSVPTELFINGTAGGVRLVMPDNSTWTYKVTVSAHRTDLGDGHAGYTAQGVIFRNSGVGTTSLQGSVNKVVLAESNPSWDINISADTVNGSLKVTVTGEAGKTIRWLAMVETVEITN